MQFRDFFRKIFTCDTSKERFRKKKKLIDKIKQLILFPTLTIYSIVKKYVTINNKENTDSTLPTIIFLQTRSHFIVFDFISLISVDDASG